CQSGADARLLQTILKGADRGAKRVRTALVALLHERIANAVQRMGAPQTSGVFEAATIEQFRVSIETLLIERGGLVVSCKPGVRDTSLSFCVGCGRGIIIAALIRRVAATDLVQR